MPTPRKHTASKSSQDKHSTSISSEQIKAFFEEHKEELINEIKDKAVKATMETITPLLEKLQEASKQSAQEIVADAELSYEDQIKQLQTVAKEKMKMQELKIAEKMKLLQTKIAKRI